MSTIIVFTAEEIGGDFEFFLPDDGCRDYPLYYGDDGSVFFSQKWKGKVKQASLSLPDDEENNKNNNNMLLQIYPVLKNKSKQADPYRFKAKGGAGGGGTLMGKDSKHESVSISTPTSSDWSLDDHDHDHHGCLVCEKPTWVRHAIISHYLGHFFKSMAIPLVFQIGGCPVGYSATPDPKVPPIINSIISKRNNITLGFPLIEVFSVVIKNNNKNNQEGGCVSLYGTIHMYNGLESEFIYSRKREDSESISFTTPGGGDTIELNGPSMPRPISVVDSLWIDLDLMDKKDTNDDDDVFYKGKMYWNFHCEYVETYDDDEKGDFTSQIVYRPPYSAFHKPLATIFNGRSGGSVTINYAMLLEGVLANVEVSLLDLHGEGDGAAAAHVYGLIQAGSNCQGFPYWSVLLRKKKENDEFIDVRPGQLIPLSRSLVGVNGCSSLKVSVELYDRLRHTDLSQDHDEIVKGTVDFPAQLYGTSEEYISGCYGEIQVKVTWLL